MFVAVVRNVELDGRARAVAVEHIGDAALSIDHQRDVDHPQVEFRHKWFSM
jgi:hypothetical protein